VHRRALIVPIAQVFSVVPHMHARGRRMRVRLVRDGVELEPLFDSW
jgi:hypothetical protein